MSKYYYKFPAESREGKLLRSFHRAAIKAETEAENYAKKVGADVYYENPNAFAGGVSAVAFKDKQKVNPNIWRFVGKQQESGDFLFVPNVTVVAGHRTLKNGEKIPRDNACRIWMSPRTGKVEGERIAKYLDITANATEAPKADRRRAVQAERWRLKLPVMRTSSFYQIVHADLAVLDGTAAPKKIQASTPVFFLYHGYYYIGLDYPIRHEKFDPITMFAFNTTKREMLYEAEHRNVEDENDL